MDADTDPRDVIQVTQWTTKEEVRKQLREYHHSWCYPDIVQDPGIVFTMLFLTRDMGLEAELEPFRCFLSDRAQALCDRLDKLGTAYEEPRNAAHLAYDHANGLNGRAKSIFEVVFNLRHAVARSACIAVNEVLGEFSLDFDDAQKKEDLVLAKRLQNTLITNGLI